MNMPWRCRLQMRSSHVTTRYHGLRPCHRWQTHLTPDCLRQTEVASLFDTMDLHFHSGLKYTFQLYRDLSMQSEAVNNKCLSTIYEAADRLDPAAEKVSHSCRVVEERDCVIRTPLSACIRDV